MACYTIFNIIIICLLFFVTHIRRTNADPVNSYSSKLNQQLLATKPLEPQGSAPRVLYGLKDQNVEEGRDVVFKCGITGEPEPNIRWTRNGIEMLPTERFTTTFHDNTAAFKVRRVRRDDAGTYAVMAQNKYGVVQSAGVLNVLSTPSDTPTQQVQRPAMAEQRSLPAGPTPQVNYPTTGMVAPKIVQAPDPHDLHVNEDQTVRLNLRVIGKPTPTVEWYRHDQVLAGMDRFKTMVNEEGVHSLLITKATLDDAGLYTFIARNPAGEAVANMQLDVAPARRGEGPEFIEKFSSLTVREGDPYTLHCAAVGDPMPKLNWMKDGTEQWPDNPYRIQFKAGSSTLAVDSAEKGDGGWYQCSATNARGTATLRARVTVIPRLVQPPSQFPLGPPSEREIITLQHVERAQPHRREDPPESPPEAPRFHSRPDDLHELRQGSAAHMECRLTPTNDPRLKVIWLLNGTPIKIGSRFQYMCDFGFCTLDVNPIYPEDSGTYTCRAVNLLGQDEVGCNVSVQRDPSIITTSLLSPEVTETLRQIDTRAPRHFETFQLPIVKVKFDRAPAFYNKHHVDEAIAAAELSAERMEQEEEE